MNALPLIEVLGVAKDLTVMGALLLALWGGATKRWVWGHHYDEALAREMWWRDYATALHELTNQAVQLAERRRK